MFSYYFFLLVFCVLVLSLIEIVHCWFFIRCCFVFFFMFCFVILVFIVYAYAYALCLIVMFSLSLLVYCFPYVLIVVSTHAFIWICVVYSTQTLYCLIYLLYFCSDFLIYFLSIKDFIVSLFTPISFCLIVLRFIL